LLIEEQEKEAVSAKELKETRHGLNELSIEAESLKEILVETCALKDKLENQLLQAFEELKDSVPAVTQSLAANEEEVETLKQSLREESDNVMHLTDELAKVA
jgi:predicted RNase H-like nuclease (RuvC/YqgF family)